MADLEPGTVELYPSCTPRWAAGSHRLELFQEVREGSAVLLTASAPTADDHVFVEVAGGADPLGPTDVLAAYPADGSRDASPHMLPHLVLARRTLPWELTVPTAGAPWLTLLLLRPDEVVAVTPAASGGLPRVSVTTATLRRLLPRQDELALTCHVRRVSTRDRERLGDDDGFVTIVVGNRLPATAGPWTAFAVGLHQAWGEPIWPGTAGGTTVDLPVLHSWSFAVAAGGDFEELCGGLRSRAASFTTAEAALRYQGRDGTVTTAGYRSPLAGTTAPTGDVGASFSGQAMFELGRLLALSDGAALAQLQTLRDQAWEYVWFKTIYTQFASPDGLPLDGFPGLTDELRAKLAGLVAKLEKEWLTQLGGRGGPGSLDDILGGLPIGVLPGGGRPPLPGPIIDRIRELIGGGVTDPVRVGPIDRPVDRIDRPVDRIDRPVGPIAQPAEPPADVVDPRLSSFLDRMRAGGTSPGLLGRLADAARGRLPGRGGS